MTVKLYDLAKVSTATTGTGTITLGSAVSGFLTFAAAGVQNGEIVRYGIRDGANSEIGYGTYTSSGTTLTRTVTSSTNANAAISLSGSAQVFICASSLDVGTGRVIVGTYSASNAATLDMTGWYSSRFDQYELEIFDVYPATNNVNLQLRVSTDNGSTYDAGSNYSAAANVIVNGSSVVGTSTGTEFVLVGSQSNGANYSTIATLKLSDPAGSLYKTFLGSYHMRHNTGPGPATGVFGMTWQNTGAYNGIRLLYSSGNISGKARIYGIGK